MSTMYCPNCKMNVTTVKKDINVPLAILLAIFTGGIGLLIYLAIYVEKEANLCIHCKKECLALSENVNSNYNSQSQTISYQIQEYSPIKKESPVKERPRYCFNCGVEREANENANFCHYCGVEYI